MVVSGRCLFHSQQQQQQRREPARSRRIKCTGQSGAKMASMLSGWCGVNGPACCFIRLQMLQGARALSLLVAAAAAAAVDGGSRTPQSVHLCGQTVHASLRRTRARRPVREDTRDFAEPGPWASRSQPATVRSGSSSSSGGEREP